MEGLPNEGNSAFLNVLGVDHLCGALVHLGHGQGEEGGHSGGHQLSMVGGWQVSPQSREAGQCGVSNLVIFPEWRIFISGLMLQLPWRLVRIFFLVWSC